MDGTSYGRAIKIGIVLTIPDGSLIEQSYTLRFFAINNKVEFEKIFVGLKMTTTIGIMEIEVHCDSLLTVSKSMENIKPKTIRWPNTQPKTIGWQ